MPDPRTQHKDIPFTGKFWTTEPAAIGQNFRTLKNMRYTDTHIKGVAGMTKINATAKTTYLKTRNAFHFDKSQPQESHIVLHVLSTAGDAQVQEHTAVIPGTGSFSGTALMTASGTGLGRFSDAPDGQMIYANGVDTCIWGGNEIKCGAVISIQVELTAANDVPTIPRDYTEQVNNTKSDSANVFTCGDSYKTILIGSPRPAQGATFTFSSYNATPNTLVIKESTATVWTTCTTSSDGTRTGETTSFAQNGKVVWPTTVSTTKPKHLEGYYLYWYEITISAGSAEISHITLDCPFQPIIDMWDGIFRNVTRFYTHMTTYVDNTINVLLEDYDFGSTGTYAFGPWTAFSEPNNCFEIGFTEKMTGLRFVLGSEYENTTAATTMSIDYWNGIAYITCGTISDGTSEGDISFAKSGVTPWNSNSYFDETKKVVSNSPPLYYYRVRFDKQLLVSVGVKVRLDYVGGISAQNEINYFKFPVFAQGRILLCADMSGEKNKAICSGKYMPQVYNGVDSVEIYFGEEGELTCGIELFSLFGSSLYSLILMFKDNETWFIAGQDIDQWENNTFLLSSSIGCPEPLTLKTINLHADPGVGINRMLAIWRGANGIYMSDGRAPIPIHGDIKEYFDPLDPNYIAVSGNEISFVDPVRQEYHWLAGGHEFVYDIARNKWFEIDRIVDLQCGVTVHDIDGIGYTYGFLDTGYMERLESGLPTVSTVTLTHYSDGKTSGTDITLSPTRSGYRLAQPVNANKLNADPFHSFKLVATTTGDDFDGNSITYTIQFGDIPLGGLMMETRMSDLKLIMVANATDGFEPLAIGTSFHPVSDRTDY